MISKEEAEQVARNFLENKLPNKVGKTLRVMMGKTRSNQYWENPVYNIEEGFTVMFEKSWNPGHWYVVYVSLDGAIAGGDQCR